jgi:hypothetical protein
MVEVLAGVVGLDGAWVHVVTPGLRFRQAAMIWVQSPESVMLMRLGAATPSR